MEGYVIILTGLLYMGLYLGVGLLLRRYVHGKVKLILAGLAAYLVLTGILLFVVFPSTLNHPTELLSCVLAGAVFVPLCAWGCKELERRVQSKVVQAVFGGILGLVLTWLFFNMTLLLDKIFQ